jgi:Tfp pilus assembly protein PilN
VVFTPFFYQTYVTPRQKNNLTFITKTHMELGTQIQEIRRLQDQLKGLRQQQSILETITRKQPYAKVLAQLAQVMDPGTWLTMLTMDDGEDKDSEPRLKLAGLSLSNEELGNFLHRLSRESLFKSVVLKYADETEVSPSEKHTRMPGKRIRFQVECRVSRG